MLVAKGWPCYHYTMPAASFLLLLLLVGGWDEMKRMAQEWKGKGEFIPENRGQWGEDVTGGIVCDDAVALSRAHFGTGSSSGLSDMTVMCKANR